jgi:hypothetical protein
MEPVAEKMETQLRLWGLKIDRLAAQTEIPGVQASFDTLMHIDELKALRAIAEATLLEFKGAGDTSRARLETEMTNAGKDLEAAFKKPMP